MYGLAKMAGFVGLAGLTGHGLPVAGLPWRKLRHGCLMLGGWGLILGGLLKLRWLTLLRLAWQS